MDIEGLSVEDNFPDHWTVKCYSVLNVEFKRCLNGSNHEKTGRALVLVSEEMTIIWPMILIKPALFFILPFPHLLVFIADSAQPHWAAPAVAPDTTLAAHVLQTCKYIHKHIHKEEEELVSY